MNPSRLTFTVLALVAVCGLTLAQNDPGSRGKGGSGGGSGGNSGGSSGGSSGGRQNGDGSRDRSGGGSSGDRDRNNQPYRSEQSSDSRTKREDAGGRKQEKSRSGEVRYSSTNNVTVTSSQVDSRTFRSFPREQIPPSLADQVRRSDRNVSVNLSYNGFRTGYCQYNRNWRDDNFYYPFYQFQPVRNVVCSPWYLYSNLPPYIFVDRITILTPPSSFYNNWDPISYRYYGRRSWSRNWDSDRDRYADQLDDTLDDIMDAFERRDRRRFEQYIPNRGTVAISQDGVYAYSLDVDDFADLATDLIQGTRTNDYRVVNVRTQGLGRVNVLMQHNYTDSWNYNRTVWHSYVLEAGRRGRYEITEFGTSSYRNW